MKRIRLTGVVVFVMAAMSGGVAHADVRAEQKSTVKFEGMLGRVMNVFGGKAAKEGIVTTDVVKGDRMMRASDTTGEIIDLAEEKIYRLDTRKKTYTVTTFAELRRQMQEAQARAAANADNSADRQPERREGSEKEVEIDFSMKESGQRKNLNGYDCREVVTTIVVREKGKTLEQGGGLVLTVDSWLAPRIAAMQEIVDFNQRYFRKLEGPLAPGASPDQMAAAAAMYPLLKEALSKLNTENVNVDGSAILTTMTIETVKTAEEMSRESKQEDTSVSAGGGVGGLLGGLGRRIAKKREKSEGDGAARNRATIMTINSELLKVSTDVAAGDVAVPAGFQQK